MSPSGDSNGLAGRLERPRVASGASVLLDIAVRDVGGMRRPDSGRFSPWMAPCIADRDP